MNPLIRPEVRAAVSAEEWQARVDLAACYRLVAAYGWADLVFTHISAKLPGPDEHFLINPYGALFQEITASSLVKVNLHGEVIGESPFPVNPAGFTIRSPGNGFQAEAENHESGEREADGGDEEGLARANHRDQHSRCGGADDRHGVPDGAVKGHRARHHAHVDQSRKDGLLGRVGQCCQCPHSDRPADDELNRCRAGKDDTGEEETERGRRGLAKDEDRLRVIAVGDDPGRHAEEDSRQGYRQPHDPDPDRRAVELAHDKPACADETELETEDAGNVRDPEAAIVWESERAPARDRFDR